MNTREYRKSNGKYIFFNANPKSRLSACDCSIRAIAKATDESWENVFTGLFKIGLKLKDVVNSKIVIKEYLKEHGYKMENQLRKTDNTRYTVNEFVDLFSAGTYIVLLTSPYHMTVVMKGKIYDTWNTSYKYVGNYWRIK